MIFRSSEVHLDHWASRNYKQMWTKKKKKYKQQPVRENRGGKKGIVIKSITLEINNTTIVNIPHW